MAPDLRGPVQLERIIHAYKFWINSNIEESSLPTVSVLEKDLSDGKILLYLINHLTGELPYIQYGSPEKNVEEVLLFIKKQKIQCDISMKALTRGDLQPVLDIVWLILLHFDIHSKERAPYQRTFRLGQILLLEWLQDKLPELELDCKQPLKIVLQSGTVMYNIIQQCVDPFCYKPISNSPSCEDLNLILNLASTLFKEPNVPFSAQDLLDGNVDEVTLVIYLTIIRRKTQQQKSPNNQTTLDSTKRVAADHQHSESNEDDLLVCLEYISKEAIALNHEKELMEVETLKRVAEQLSNAVNLQSKNVPDHYEKKLQDELSLLASENYQLMEELNELRRYKIENAVLKKLLDSANRKCALSNKKIEAIWAQNMEFQKRLAADKEMFNVRESYIGTKILSSDIQSTQHQNVDSIYDALKDKKRCLQDDNYFESNEEDDINQERDHSGMMFNGNHVDGITNQPDVVDPFNLLLQTLECQLEFSRSIWKNIVEKTCDPVSTTTECQLFLGKLKRMMVEHEQEIKGLNSHLSYYFSSTSPTHGDLSTTCRQNKNNPYSIKKELDELETFLDILKIEKNKLEWKCKTQELLIGSLRSKLFAS